MSILRRDLWGKPVHRGAESGQKRGLKSIGSVCEIAWCVATFKEPRTTFGDKGH